MNTFRHSSQSSADPPARSGIRSWAGRYRHLLPASRAEKIDPALVWTFITHLSVVRSLVLSAHFRGWS